MRFLLLAAFSLVLPYLPAQTPFQGGTGNGYARIRLSAAPASLSATTAAQVLIRPTLLSPDQELEVILPHWAGRPFRVSLFDLTGKEIWAPQAFSGSPCRLHPGPLAPGVYLVRVEAEGLHSVSRILVQNNRP